MKDKIDQIVKNISETLIHFELDYELDIDNVLDEFTHDLMEKDAKKAFDNLLSLVMLSTDSEIFNEIRLKVNNLIIESHHSELFKPIISYLQTEHMKKIKGRQKIDLLEKYRQDVNDLINRILKTYHVDFIDFNKRLVKKGVDYINPLWIDRSKGRHLCLFFKNIPESQEFSSKQIYSDIYARDKSKIGYIYQADPYFKNEEKFYLARGPMMKRDSNTVYVIDNVGLSLCRLPSIANSRGRTTADLVPELLDIGYRMYAQYMDNKPGHFKILQSNLISKQPEWVGLNEYDEFLVYFSISLLVYLKQLIKNEDVHIIDEGVFLDISRDEKKNVGDVLKELLMEKNSTHFDKRAIDMLLTITNTINKDFTDDTHVSELVLDLGYYSELYSYLYPEI